MINSIRCLIFSLWVGLSLTACATPITSQPPTQITTQLSWRHEYSSAIFYAAEHNGHFGEENLQVSLNAANFVDGRVQESIDEVVNGTVDFATTSASSLMDARANGKPVVGIATILQRSPVAIISLPASGIQRPSDLVGKTIAVAEGGSRLLYDALLETQGVDPAQINTIPRTQFGVDPLLSGEVDAIVGWATNEGVALREEGIEPHLILFSDYGFETYDFTIFTSEDTIKNKPDLILRFLRALIQGAEDVIADPEEAAEFTLLYDAELDLPGQLRRLEIMTPLIRPATTEIGMIQAERWNTLFAILSAGGMVPASLDATTGYTNQFLEQIYRTVPQPSN